MKTVVTFCKKGLTSFIIFLSASSLTWGLSCPKELSVQDIAKMLIKAELSGIRVEDMEASPCLNQSNFPYLHIASDYNLDETSEVQATVLSENPINNLIVKLVDKDTLQYTASYSLKTENKVISDSINFVLYADLENQKEFGCAGVTKEPDIRAVFGKCLIKLTAESVISTLEKADYTAIKGRYNLYTYYESAVSVLEKEGNKDVLVTIIKSYIKEFRNNPTHFNLEPFIPFYKNNKAQVITIINKLATKTEAEDLLSRIRIALREFEEGNG